MTVDSRLVLWEEFLTHWPVDKVEAMSLFDYAGRGNKDSFTYWLEIKLRSLGNIAGGSAFKFGVYGRASNEEKEAGNGRDYDDSYGWYIKLGATAQDAFNSVRESILRIIKSVQANDLDAIDADTTFGPVVKWKIAFLYQDRQNPVCLPVYSEEMLRRYSDLNEKASHANLVRHVMPRLKSDETLFEFTDRLWKEGSTRIWKLSHGLKVFTEEQREYFRQHQLAVMHPETKKGQGYQFLNAGNEPFFLCNGNKVVLLGLFSGEPEPCNEAPGFVQRPYQVLFESPEPRAFVQPNPEKSNNYGPSWYPNRPTTFRVVDDIQQFESIILEEHFGITLKELNDKLLSLGVTPIGKHVEVKTEWFPKNYDPGFSVDAWVEMLHDQELFRDPEDLKVMKRLKHFGGQATCQQLALTYGGKFTDYNTASWQLAKRIHQKTNCPVIKDSDSDNSRWWPILYLGHDADKSTPGSFVWKLRPELSKALERINMDHIPLYEDSSDVEQYSDAQLYDELWMVREDVDSLIRLIKYKKNVILQGAPGVGKTYTAKRLAYALMGVKDESRIKMIQFHQSYSYEDFIMGYKPSKDGFELRSGVFYEFCRQATKQPEKDFFFIIDEINRGNLSKILGELMMLIERDHRGESLTLAYDGKSFCVPKNVYLIGMMNTADRSLALIDYALRRRFSFFEIAPGFESEGFKQYQASLGNEKFDDLIETVKLLNESIVKDDSLGSGFQIAHSYFCKPEDVEDIDLWLKEVVQYDLLPTLSEYWFDDHETLKKWKDKLMGVVNGS